MKTKIAWLSIILGLLVLIAGVVVSPSIVSRHLSADGLLDRETKNTVIDLQVFATTLGVVLLILGFGLRSARLLRILLVPSVLVYFFILHRVYIEPTYPANNFLRPEIIVKAWNVLLGRELFLSDFEPTPLLVTEKHEVLRAKYPVINVHAHFTYWKEVISHEEMIRIMDNCGIERTVDLDGYPPNELKNRIEEYRTKYEGRFLQFYHLWFPDGPLADTFYQKSVDALEEAVKMGARGLKVWRNLGLKTVDHSGSLLAVDDPRLDPIWMKAGELAVPALIHVADRDAEFLSVDRHNELYEMLSWNPAWSFADPSYPPKARILEQFANVVRKHPKTQFIAAHMAMMAENLGYLSSLLDQYDNLYVDLSSQVPELGRKPYSSRNFFIKYQDRILFGTDGNPREDAYRVHFRFLETSDEYFDYPFSDVHSLGRWKIYGLALPDEVLEKIYYQNAARLILKQDEIKKQKRARHSAQ
jgi:predicted TIM-barrel fold metal-dependent hydrolase